MAIALGTEPVITLMAATPMLYDQLEYRMAAVMQGKPYRVVKTAKGLDVPWGAEYVLEGAGTLQAARAGGALRRVPRLLLGLPQLSGDRDRSRIAPQGSGINSVYVGRPWTELDYLQAMTTCVPIFVQLNTEFPRGDRCQCALHARFGRYRFNEDALWRLCQGHRLARADHNSWSRVCQDCHRCQRRTSIRSTSIR